MADSTISINSLGARDAVVTEVRVDEVHSKAASAQQMWKSDAASCFFVRPISRKVLVRILARTAPMSLRTNVHFFGEVRWSMVECTSSLHPNDMGVTYALMPHGRVI